MVFFFFKVELCTGNEGRDTGEGGGATVEFYVVCLSTRLDSFHMQNVKPATIARVPPPTPAPRVRETA